MECQGALEAFDEPDATDLAASRNGLRSASLSCRLKLQDLAHMVSERATYHLHHEAKQHTGTATCKTHQ
eukprot:15082636-Alexandrium_andersonii.AAC.1